MNAACFYWQDGTMGGTCTAACVAARRGHLGVLGVLLAAPVSADPDKGDTSDGWAPLHAACNYDNPDAVTVLLAHGADPNLADKEGVTPCMMAACWGHTASLWALADGAARQEGRTLDVNAVSTSGNWKGRTALDLAVDHNKDEAAAYLRDELGALTNSEVRARATRARIRKFVLHARAVGWFVWRYKAAKARVDFAPGGTGAQKAAAEFASVAATEAAKEVETDDVPPPPRKRQRTE